MAQGIELQNPSPKHPLGRQHWWRWIKGMLRPAGPLFANDQDTETVTVAEALVNAGQGAVVVTAPPTMPDWWSVIQRYSRLLVAVVDLGTYRIEWTSDRFRKLVGMTECPPTLGEVVLGRLSQGDQRLVRERVRRHVLNAILTRHYGQSALIASRWLHEPLIVAVGQTSGDRPRYVEFSVSSDLIQIEHLAEPVQAALNHCWATAPDPSAVMNQLYGDDTPLQAVLEQLSPQTYQASGTILIEGVDITEREVAQRLIQLLLDRESILEPTRFHQVNVLMQRLFRAQDSLILTVENDVARIYTDLDAPIWTETLYPVATLQASPLFQTACDGKVLPVPNLMPPWATPFEQVLGDRGAKSVLMLPLMVQSPQLQISSRLFGLVALVSDQVDGFDTIDQHHAETLVPALIVAMRQTVQDGFSNIHPSVRWRFEEEAERRSLGLPPQAITFTNVYPLYGISDIRGSSKARNQSIQTDLLAQLRLGLAVVDAIAATDAGAFIQQLRLDVITHIEDLEQSVTVDAEVTLVRYLQRHLEDHFDYFRQCGPAAAAAIATYLAAQNPDHGCVYNARAAYDQMIHHINQALMETWQQQQRTMQQITRHYCDIEATDGIDHMMYVGASIDGTFTDFHLHSLRYEQLRAVCACARTSFALKAHHDTEMDITHLVLVQDTTVDITHDENTERLFEVRGTRDTRYEIVKKRIDKAIDAYAQTRITQPGCLTLVYSTVEEWSEYQEYVRYLQREGWVDLPVEQGSVEPLQGVTGLKFARVRVLPEA